MVVKEQQLFKIEIVCNNKHYRSKVCGLFPFFYKLILLHSARIGFTDKK